MTPRVLPDMCTSSPSPLQRCWAGDPDMRPPFERILAELFQMKKECDADVAAARREGNVVLSRFSEEVPGVPGARAAARRRSSAAAAGRGPTLTAGLGKTVRNLGGCIVVSCDDEDEEDGAGGAGQAQAAASKQARVSEAEAAPRGSPLPPRVGVVPFAFP